MSTIISTVSRNSFFTNSLLYICIFIRYPVV
nr:MAG TPA: hypothetical protein [Inoviridae sp.]